MSLESVFGDKGKDKAVTKHNAMKTYWGSGGIVPRILSHRTRCR